MKTHQYKADKQLSGKNFLLHNRWRIREISNDTKCDQSMVYTRFFPYRWTWTWQNLLHATWNQLWLCCHRLDYYDKWTIKKLNFIPFFHCIIFLTITSLHILRHMKISTNQSLYILYSLRNTLREILPPAKISKTLLSDTTSTKCDWNKFSAGSLVSCQNI